MEELLAQLKNVTLGAQRIARSLAGYQRLLSDPVNNAFAREEALTGVSGLVARFPESSLRAALDKWVGDERSAVEKDKEEFRFGFGTQLAAGLEEVGLKVRGQLPVLRVGMFSVRIDFGAGRAVVFWGPEVERLKAVSRLVPAELARILAQWTKSLKDKAMEPDRFGKLIVEALRRVYARSGLAEGSRVLLLELLSEVVLMMQPKSFRADPSKEKFVEYPRVQFSYDLFRYRFSDRAGSQLRLHVATFDATTDKARALWVPDNEEGEGTYYAYGSVPAGNA